MGTRQKVWLGVKMGAETSGWAVARHHRSSDIMGRTGRLRRLDEALTQHEFLHLARGRERELVDEDP